MKNLVFLGPPGAGKGTQASRVSARLGLPHISTGDMLRTAIREKTPTGLHAKTFMDKGELVPDEVVIQLVKERIAQPDCKEGYILDGFPRTIPQAEALDAVTTISQAINIAVEDEKLVLRLSGRRVCPDCSHTTHVDVIGPTADCPKCHGTLVQREDDKPDTIRNRLAVYSKNTQPLIDYYSRKGILVDIDGYRGFEVIANDIVAAIQKL